MVSHSSIFAWEIPWTEEPGGLQSMGSQSRTRWSDWHTQTCTHLLNSPWAPRGLIFFLSLCSFRRAVIEGDQEGAVTVSSQVNKLTEWLPDDSSIRVYFLLLHLGTFWTFSLEVICFDLKCALLLRVKTPLQKQGFGHCVNTFFQNNLPSLPAGGSITQQ